MRRPTAEVASLAAILASQALPPQSLGVPGLLQRDRPNCAIPSAQRLFAALQFDEFDANTLITAAQHANAVELTFGQHLRVLSI